MRLVSADNKLLWTGPADQQITNFYRQDQLTSQYDQDPQSVLDQLMTNLYYHDPWAVCCLGPSVYRLTAFLYDYVDVADQPMWPVSADQIALLVPINWPIWLARTISFYENNNMTTVYELDQLTGLYEQNSLTSLYD